MTIFRNLKIQAIKYRDLLKTPLLVNKYFSQYPKNERKLILGDHWSDNPGWLILNEAQQDITKKLRFPSNSFKVIFLEHVIEHLELKYTIGFFKEAKRILQKGGILRLVWPSLEKIISSDLNKSNPKNNLYINNILINLNYKDLDKQLKSIGLKGIKEDANTFFLNSIFKESGHKFISSAKLIKSILKALKFKRVDIFKPGEGNVAEYCIERRNRGIYLGYDWKKDKKTKKIFDIESLVVEAVK